jgi:predicted N-formylglutamate amidohydrolase
VWWGEEGKKMAIVLTVPHAVCAGAGAHPCDFAAEEAALRIYRGGGGGDGKEVEAPRVPQFVARDECDLNRRRCRGHPWRESLRKRIARGDVAFVLDVHSYPPHTRGWSKFEIVVLDDTPSPQPFAGYAVDFVQYMAKHGVEVGIGRGVNNDIQDEVRANHGIRSMLLEFNESLLSDSARFAFIAERTARWLVKKT